MHFDDRLVTVLRMPVTGQAMSRIQFRQLVDLLGAATGPVGNTPAGEAAIARIDALARAIPATERAAILREPAVRLASPELISRLVLAEPEVASAAIAAADLSETDWLALIPALPVRARGILRHRRGMSPKVDALLERLGIGDRGLPPAHEPAPSRPPRPELVVLEGGGASTARRAPREEPSPAGIGAIVRRIEAFRKARTSDEAEGDTGRVPLAGIAIEPHAVVVSLDLTTGPEGRVDWADGAVAPSLVGLHLASAGAPGSSETLQVLMRHRQPLRNVTIALTGASDLTGTWRLDALPRFGAPDGRFLGYAGRLRRIAGSDAFSGGPGDGAADSMRQVLHELRTPANAIQVAAEIIQQQLYGPAPHEYRALAAAIAGDTAQILAGFEELDRLVRLESGVLTLGSGACDLQTLVHETVDRLRSWTTPRGGEFRLKSAVGSYVTTLDPEEGARLVWRLLAALAGAMEAGEAIDLALTSGAAEVGLVIDVPLSLAARIDDAYVAGATSELVRSLSAGIFGTAFTLRLAAAEAAAAGGVLTRDGGRFSLALPGLTPVAAGHTQV